MVVARLVQEAALEVVADRGGGGVVEGCGGVDNEGATGAEAVAAEFSGRPDGISGRGNGGRHGTEARSNC